MFASVQEPCDSSKDAGQDYIDKNRGSYHRNHTDWLQEAGNLTYNKSVMKQKEDILNSPILNSKVSEIEASSEFDTARENTV